MDYFVYGDVNTQTYGIYIFPMNIDDAPDITQEKIAVPGRHGSLLFTERTFENVRHRYMGVCYTNAESTLQSFRAAIMRQEGYVRLTDSFHTDEFYKARYVGGLEPEFALGRDMVKFVIEFDRKPQRFLTSGENVTTITSSTTITNPSRMPARPLITAYGKGTFTIGGQSVSILSTSPYSNITIDCEMMDCYNGVQNCNRYVTLPNYKFPTIGAGSSSGSVSISLSGVTRLDITPRWWRV